MKAVGYFRLAKEPHEIGFMEALQTGQLHRYAKPHRHDPHAAIAEYLAATGSQHPQVRINRKDIHK